MSKGYGHGPYWGDNGKFEYLPPEVTEVKCDCVGQFGPNPDCLTCGGGGTCAVPKRGT